MLQVAGEVIGFLDGGARPRVPCAVEGWHCREVPEHGTQAREHPPRVPCGRDGERHEGGPARSRKQLAAPQVSVPTIGWEGGEGGPPDGRWGEWRRGVFLA